MSIPYSLLKKNVCATDRLVWYKIFVFSAWASEVFSAVGGPISPYISGGEPLAPTPLAPT